MFQSVSEYGYFVQSFQKVAPGRMVRFTLKPASRNCAGDRVAGVLVPFLVAGDDVVLEVDLAGVGHQLLRAGDVARLLRQLVIFRMDRRDMVVLADRAAIVEAELEHGRVVDRHLQRVADPLVVVRLLLDVAAVDDGRRGLDVGARRDQPCP